MSTADESLEQVRAVVALYALGLLPPDEAAAVEARLAAGDVRYAEEVAAFRTVSDALAYAAHPRAPRPQARERVLARIAADRAEAVEQAGVRFVHVGRVAWAPGWVPGVEFKRLQTDEARQRATMLVRLAPGTVYPRHRHGDVEEIFLIEGELTVNGVRMQAGDYCRAEADSIHNETVSPHGCLFIVNASTRDELLA